MAVDGNIAGVVEIIKKLDYVELVSEGCQGHIKSYLEQYNQLAEPGYVFIFGGSLLFNIKNPRKAKPFLKCLHSITSKYHFAELSKHECDESDCPITHSFNLRIDDLVKDNVPPQIKGKDSLEAVQECNSYHHLVTYEVGLRRIVDFNKTWLKLYQRLCEHIK